MIRISIVDDHHLIINSVRNILESSGQFIICGTYNRAEDLLEGIKQTDPEIVIIDFHLPDMNGAQLAKIITYHYPRTKIIALTGFDKPGLATEMLESGCSGYLSKTSVTPEYLLEVIHEVFAGKICIDKEIRNQFAANIQKMKKPFFDDLVLTKRELEILHLIVAEKNSQEIAEELFISKKTVDNHRSSILMKTGAKNTLGLIKKAYELRLL